MDDAARKLIFNTQHYSKKELILRLKKAEVYLGTSLNWAGLDSIYRPDPVGTRIQTVCSDIATLIAEAERLPDSLNAGQNNDEKTNLPPGVSTLAITTTHILHGGEGMCGYGRGLKLSEWKPEHEWVKAVNADKSTCARCIRDYMVVRAAGTTN
jgi:hypothetical protein